MGRKDTLKALIEMLKTAGLKRGLETEVPGGEGGRGKLEEASLPPGKIMSHWGTIRMCGPALGKPALELPCVTPVFGRPEEQKEFIS